MEIKITLRKIVLLLFSLVLFFYSESSSAQFQINGVATQMSCDTFRLTPALATQVGSVWNTNQINLNTSFDYSFSVYLGCTNAGADGICFALVTSTSSIGASGGSLGYGGITPSFAVEMDTYQNGWDPVYDHVAILKNGDMNHTTANTLAAPVSATSAATDIENCVYHTLRVVWNAVTFSFDVYFDGAFRLNYTGNIVSSIFSGNPNVYWGFTGSTGGANNDQRFAGALIPKFVASDTSVCPGDVITFTDSSTSNLNILNTWSWDFGDGNTSSLQSPSHAYSVPGSYVVQLTISDPSGCQRSITHNITVNTLPVIQISPASGIICEGGNISLTASGANTYAWSPSAGLNVDTGATVTATLNSTSSYTVTGTATGGCSDTASVTILTVAYPVISFTPVADSGCAPLTVQFINGTVGANTFTWTFGDGTSDKSIHPQHTWNLPGSYWIKLEANAAPGCISVDSILAIKVFPLPVASFSLTPDVTSISSPLIQFTDLSIAATTWNWNFGDLAGTSVLQNPSYSYTAPGYYTIQLIVTSVDGCLDTAQRVVRVDDDFAVYIPNAFTPNNDGVNETFSAVGAGFIDFEMTIFDRWGMEIFYSNDFSKTWNGKFSGTGLDCMIGNYHFLINVHDKTGNIHQYTGSVSLIR